MALFKIFKGSATALGATNNGTNIAHDGYAYFTPDDGKFYIDVVPATATTIDVGVSLTAMAVVRSAATPTGNRIPLSADKADRADDFLVAGNLTVNNNAYIDALSANSLIVSGPSQFINTMQATTLNTNQISATTIVSERISSSTITGYLSGTAAYSITASNAINDKDGNAIDTTYIKNSIFTGAYQMLYSSTVGTPAVITPNTSAANSLNFLTMSIDQHNYPTTPTWITISKTEVGLENVLNATQVTSLWFDDTALKYSWQNTGKTAGSFLSGTDISVTQSKADLKFSHNTSGATTGTYGATQTSTLSYGNSFNVPQFTINATGHITSATSQTITLPNTVTAAWNSWITGTTSGPKASINIGGTSYTSQAIPAATSAQSGVITTTAQSFSGTKTFYSAIMAPTPTTGDSSTAVATTQFVANAIGSGFAANDAMVFKGTLGATNGTTSSVPTSGYSAGWTYRVVDANVYAGEYCEIGDLLIAINDGPASGSSVITADWTKVQTNIEGTVYRSSTNLAVGATNQPVYVSSNGVVVAGTTLGASAYHDDNYFVQSSQLINGTTQQAGIVQLSNATNSNSETLAATPKAVSAAYNAAISAQSAANATKYWADIEISNASTTSTSPKFKLTTLDGSSSNIKSLEYGINFNDGTTTTGHISMANSGSLGMYVSGNIYIRPGSNVETGSTQIDGTDGFLISTTAITPSISEKMQLGTSTSKFSAVYATEFKGTADIAIKSLSLGNLNSGTGSSKRLSDANLSHINNGGQQLYIIQNSATNGPMYTGYLLHFNFDTTASYDSQLFIPITSTTKDNSIQWRSNNGNATDDPTWRNWKTLLDSNNYLTEIGNASTDKAGLLQFSAANTNAQINSLTAASGIPTDEDYFISQYVNGGNTTATYYRRPVSKLWSYVQEKITDNIYWANIKTTTSALFTAQPEVQNIKINGSTNATAASTKNVQLVYNTSLEVLNFVFS